MTASAYSSPQAMAAALRSGTYLSPPGRQRAAEPLERRTFARVHRNSLVRGGAWEAAWTEKVPEKEADDFLNAIRTLLKKLREDAARTGRRGPMPRIAVELVKLMGWFFKKTGRFEMTIAEMANRIGCSESAVHANLKGLRDKLKVLVWQRRMVPSGRAGERGPQYEQTSNLYRFAQLPQKVMALIYGKRAPGPEDEQVRLADQLEERLRLDGQAKANALREHEDRSPVVAAAAAKARQQLQGEICEWDDEMEWDVEDDPSPGRNVTPAFKVNPSDGLPKKPMT